VNKRPDRKKVTGESSSRGTPYGVGLQEGVGSRKLEEEKYQLGGAGMSQKANEGHKMRDVVKRQKGGVQSTANSVRAGPVEGVEVMPPMGGGRRYGAQAGGGKG